MAQLRAALITLHILAVLVLSLPSSKLLQRRSWDLPSNQRAFAALAETFSWLGFESGKDFESKLWKLTSGYVRVRDEVARPFSYYSNLAGVRQGWGMFSRPRVEPAELEIAISPPPGFETVYQPLSKEHDFLGYTLRQYRFRKLTSHLARRYNASWYDPLTKFLAIRAAFAYPEASKIRIRVVRYQTLPPPEIRAGDVAKKRYEHQRVYPAEELR